MVTLENNTPAESRARLFGNGEASTQLSSSEAEYQEVPCPRPAATHRRQRGKDSSSGFQAGTELPHAGEHLARAEHAVVDEQPMPSELNGIDSNIVRCHRQAPVMKHSMNC